MFFLLFSLKGIYWYGYQVLKCFFSEIFKKKIWKIMEGIVFWWGALVSWGYSPFPLCLCYNENPVLHSYANFCLIMHATGTNMFRSHHLLATKVCVQFYSDPTSTFEEKAEQMKGGAKIWDPGANQGQHWDLFIFCLANSYFFNETENSFRIFLIYIERHQKTLAHLILKRDLFDTGNVEA